MVDAFIKAAEAKGHEVVRFDAAMMNIGGCHACMTCFKTGKACSFDDDFNIIAPHILDSDAIVYAMPMERTAALLKWDIVGEVLIPGVFVEGDIEKTMAALKPPLLLKIFKNIFSDR